METNKKKEMEQDIYDTEQEIKELEDRKRFYPRLASGFQEQIEERVALIARIKRDLYSKEKD